MNSAAAGIGGLGQNGAIARCAFPIEEDGLSVGAALDHMQRLIGQKIPAKPRHLLLTASETSLTPGPPSGRRGPEELSSCAI
ncbi:MAG: hypothetical protein CVT81_03835 [Alphaproteobacteria bacterium HGW-Alphaproteobacteria-3]|jgi:hypothetical protein|nr:MAG: hypothetical protein CVT81_03835 [Alphaproteobacteria bacterium HGW-Alphaproteobacteria-3]